MSDAIQSFVGAAFILMVATAVVLDLAPLLGFQHGDDFRAAWLRKSNRTGWLVPGLASGLALVCLAYVLRNEGGWLYLSLLAWTWLHASTAVAIWAATRLMGKRITLVHIAQTLLCTSFLDAFLFSLGAMILMPIGFYAKVFPVSQTACALSDREAALVTLATTIFVTVTTYAIIAH